MTTDWTIQTRSHQCAATGRPFTEGESFYTLLFHEKEGFRREDLCEDAFKARNDSREPFSYWRAKYVPPPPPETEAVNKQTAEDLLRKYMDETDTGHTSARFILAVMLERKRILKEVEVKRDAGSITRIYEHAKTGEVFIVPDPQLKLAQVAEVQAQVSHLLGGTSATALQPGTTPAPQFTEGAPSPS